MCTHTHTSIIYSRKRILPRSLFFRSKEKKKEKEEEEEERRKQRHLPKRLVAFLRTYDKKNRFVACRGDRENRDPPRWRER